ncbi:MAG TPA: septum formation initiator family protein [Thermoanaerobaculia bacterium]|nr:septum formation initiator family protein [Thermoanaerobaculia bacterium]
MTPPVDSAAATVPPRERSPLLLALAVLAVLVAVGAASLRSWRDVAEQRAHEAELAAAIAKTEAAVRALEERNRRLESDPVTLERLARQQLGLVKPDDLVVVFPEQAPKAAPDSPTQAPAPPAAPTQPPQ